MGGYINSISITKNNTYEQHQRLGTKDGENDVFKLARDRQRKTRDLGKVKRIKGDDGKV